MSELEERFVTVNGQPCRVWEKGQGPALGFLGGPFGLARWTPFLDRLCEQRRVIAPSLPGFPGGLGHDQLDDLPDWVSATLDLLEAAGLDGVDLVGASVGGALAAEAAAFSRTTVRRLALIAPFGLFDPAEPVADLWARKDAELAELLCNRQEALRASVTRPDGHDALEWGIGLLRATEAAARLFSHNCDLGLHKRLHRITAPALLLWGKQDRVVPPSYATRFAEGIAGPTEIQLIDDAGHKAELDQPEQVADAILRFVC